MTASAPMPIDTRTPPLARGRRARRGFTLMELILTVGIIALLASLVIVALGGVRAAGNRAQSSNALRQMAFAYTGYSTEHRQTLMPGFATGPRLKSLGINPRLPGGSFLDPALSPSSVANPPTVSDASSYVWRLAPYLSGDWEAMFVDYRSRELIGRLNAEITGERDPAGEEAYGPATALGADIGASRVPAYGLNSVFLGGDDYHGGSDVTDRNPWDNPGNAIAATRFSQVRNPTRVTLFAPVVSWGEQDAKPANDLLPNAPVSDIFFGYPELRPPMLSWTPGTSGAMQPQMLQWRLRGDGMIEAQGDFARGGGWPIVRSGQDEVPVAHLDGSVTTETLLNLSKDLRLWSPFESGFTP